MTTVLYIITCFFHGIGLYYGLMTWYKGQSLFINSSPLHIFKSKIEQKFWTVFIGSMSNVAFLVALPLYIIIYNGSSVGDLEGIFIVAHILSAFATMIWHYRSYDDIKRWVSDEGNNIPVS